MEDSSFDRNHLASYLIYHRYKNDSKNVEYHYHTMQDKEYCDRYRKKFDSGNNVCGRPVHMDAEMVESWYPRTFAERIDQILLYFGNHIPHIGQQKAFSYQELLSIAFIDRQEQDNNRFSSTYQQWIDRDDYDCEQELDYALKYLSNCNYITYNSGGSEEEYIDLTISPDGYARIDELLKNTSHGRSVLVAMSFHDTEKLREAIRQGISDAGYYATFIDEVQHNDFITPELLKHIRDSKFVVVDLTHQNNGAYFEEGYAMGLGKPVIQLCKHGVQLHFDIAQKNTIMWDTEDDIPERLCNRIKATIE